MDIFSEISNELLKVDVMESVRMLACPLSVPLRLGSDYVSMERQPSLEEIALASGCISLRPHPALPISSCNLL